jgi:hypothetical protein
VDKTVVEVLQDAKNILMEQGVGRGAFYSNTDDAYCSVGALDVAAGLRIRTFLIAPSSADSWKVRAEATDLLEKQMCNSIVTYNDNHTPGEVLAKFDEAILEAKEKFSNG